MKASIDRSRSDAEANAAIAAAKPVRAPLAPLLAGARARGVADGLELLGAAAALLDEHGDVLHVNARAVGMMGEELFVSGQRLRAAGKQVDESLAAAITSSLRQRVVLRVALSERPEGRVSAVRIVPVAAEGEEAFQLLRAVAILEVCGERVAPGAGLN